MGFLKDLSVTGTLSPVCHLSILFDQKGLFDPLSFDIKVYISSKHLGFWCRVHFTNKP